MRRNKIAIIGTVGVPANYGGFESLVENLLDYNNYNFEYVVFCSGKSYKQKIYIYKNAHLIYLNLQANGLSSVLYDGLSLLYCFKKKPDIILLLGVSGALFLPLIKPFLKATVICNIDGIEWKRNKWNFLVKKFLKFSEALAIKFSDQIITDNKGISDYVRTCYKVDSTTIAYGANPTNPSHDHLLSLYGIKKKNYFFKVCRIEPENNIELILQAFSEIKTQTIVIVGNWDNSNFGKKMKQFYSRYTNICLIDPIYNISELDQLRSNCKGYIHGHSAGGTNPSLVEAMSLGLPIIAFDVNFNRYTLNNNGIYFKTIKDLKGQIHEFDSLDLSTEIKAIYDTYLNKYTKEKISEEYAKLFLYTCRKRTV